MSVIDDLKKPMTPEQREAYEQQRAYDRERRYQQAKQRLKNEEAAKRPLPKLIFDGDEDLHPIKWLVETIIPAEGAGVLFGETDVGKTFVALNMAIPICADLSWQGHAVAHGTAVFIEAEGSNFAVRKHAAKLEVGITPNVFKRFPFVTIHEPLGFGPDTDLTLVLARAAAIREDVANHGLPPIRFVVVDTLAQNIHGDADSNADMGAFLKLFRAYIKALSIESVFGLLIHHPGHSNKDRLRGAYSLPADLDLILHLESAEGAAHALTLSCDRIRESERFAPILLALEKRLLVMDDGCTASTLVVVPRSASAQPTSADTSLGVRIVQHIAKHPGQTTTQIREDLGVSRNQLVAEVDRLVERGRLRMIPVKYGRAIRQTYETTVPEVGHQETKEEL